MSKELDILIEEKCRLAYNQAIEDAADQCPDQIMEHMDDFDYYKGCHRVDNWWKDLILKLKK